MMMMMIIIIIIAYLRVVLDCIFYILIIKPTRCTNFSNLFLK